MRTHEPAKKPTQTRKENHLCGERARAGAGAKKKALEFGAIYHTAHIQEVNRHAYLGTRSKLSWSSTSLGTICEIGGKNRGKRSVQPNNKGLYLYCNKMREKVEESSLTSIIFSSYHSAQVSLRYIRPPRTFFISSVILAESSFVGITMASTGIIFVQI